MGAEKKLPSPLRTTSGARLTSSSANRRRILVVDDEEKLVAVLAMMLADHDVVTGTAAREALDRIFAGERFDVILCDLMMAGVGGAEFHLALSRSVPDQADRIVFMTGGIITPRVQAFIDAVPNRLLLKPFSEAELHGALAIAPSEDS